MDLIQASLKGLQFHADYYGSDTPVDFALSSEGRSVVMMANWWATEWAPGDGIEIFQAECVPEIAHQGEDPTRWIVQDVAGVELTFAADEDMADRLARARESTDLYRWEYVRALDRLQGSLGEDLDITKWIEAIKARPILDPAEELRKQNLGLRKVGRLFLRDSHGESDVLVIDEFGNAAVASGSEWLQVFADQWTEREDRPGMEDFLAWAQEQRLPVAASFEAAQVEMTAGHVEDIAVRILSGKQLDVMSRKARKGAGQTTSTAIGFAS
jgi:hypothetical protein